MNHVPGPPRQSKRLLFGVGVLALVLAAFLIGRSTSPEPSPRAPQAEADQVPDPGPTAELNGVPVGHSRTEDGAVAAAANFALLIADDSLTNESDFVRAMETAAAPSWKEEARQQARNGFDFLMNRYGSDGNLAGAILRYDVSEFSSERAVIRLWTLSVVSGSKRPTVDQVWSISTVSLEWIEDDWHVVGADSAPGPAPVGVPDQTSPLSAQDVMEVFNEFEGSVVP